MKLEVSGYNIEFGDASREVERFLKNKSYSSISVLTDNNTIRHCLPRINQVLRSHQVIEISSGEEHKNLKTCEFIWKSLLNHGADRHSLLINLGGGVIGDMGGFVASTYMRGIDFIQIPTTLLSQVDASVGGKLGVDFQGLKNFIGLFQNPQSVIIDTEFLKTLTPEETRSGYAEMIKHALIQDESIWSRYKRNKEWTNNISNAELRESVNIKRKVILQDPLEKGLRKILNFGHTLGHAIETYSFSTDSPLLHGEAIALGMIGETFLSNQLLDLPSQDLDEVRNYILSIYGMDSSNYNDLEMIISHMKHDKKNKSGKVMFSLLQSLGDSVYDIEVNTKLIRTSLEYTLNS